MSTLILHRHLPPCSVEGIFRVTSPCNDRSKNAVITPPHYAQITLVLFRSRKVAPSTVDLLLYANSPCWTQRNPGVHTIALFLPIFFWSTTLLNILTIAIRVVFTQMVLRPNCYTNKEGVPFINKQS